MIRFGCPAVTGYLRRDLLIASFVLSILFVSFHAAFAIDLTPLDIAQKTYLSEVNRLAANAYIHFRNGAVLIESGAFILPVRDLEIPIGGSSFVLERSFSNTPSSRGIFGVGWTFNFWMRLEERGEQVLVIEPGAGATLFRKMSDSRYVYEASGAQTITKNGDGSFVREDIAGTMQYFDKTGKLVKVVEGKMTLHLTYEHDKLVSIGDRRSLLVRLGYNKLGLVDEMTDPAGRKSRFEYSRNGELTKEVSFRAETTTYQYNRQHQMIAIKYSNGAMVHISYDSAGRVVLQKGPEKLTSAFHYVLHGDEKETTITDALGNKTTTVFKNGGRRVRITDFAGGTVEKIYDAKGNLAEFKDQIGRVMKFTYTDRNQLHSKTGFDGKTEEYIYDPTTSRLRSVRTGMKEIRITHSPAGLLTRFEDEYGKAIQYEYDGAHNLTAIIDSAGRRTVLAYDEKGRINRVISPDGSSQTYLYHVNGDLESVTDANGKSIKYTYDTGGNLVKITNQVGATEVMRYDESGNLIEHINAAGTRTKYTYNPFGQIASVEKGQPGNRTTFLYDTKGRLAAIGRSDGARVSVRHDSMDRVQGVSDELGRSNKYSYDAVGRLIGMTYPDGRKAGYEYSKAGLLIGVTVQGRGKTAFRHDDLGRVVSIKTDDGERRFQYDSRDRLTGMQDVRSSYYVTYKYDELGRVVEIEDGRNGKTFFHHDEFDRLVEARAESGYKEEYSYDNTGNVTQLRIAGRETVKNAYDPLGRLVRSESSRYGQSSYVYDPVGNLSALVEASGTKREYGYNDAIDQLMKVTENGATTRYSYDPAGNLRVIIDADGHETRFEYDKAGRIVKRIDPLRRMREIRYDAGDRVIKINREDGKAEKFAYSESGLLAKALANEKPIREINYDALNRIIREKGEGHSFSYVYDAAGNLIEKRDESNSANVRYAYDQSNNLVGVELPGGKKISYAHDKFNNLVGVTGPVGIRIEFGYDRFNRRDQIRLGRTAMVKYDYNDNGAVRSIKYQKPDGSTIYLIAYEYDVVGRISRADYNGQVFSYAYDERSRLKEVVYPDGQTEAYRYDLSGNIVGVNDSRLSYNAANQLTAKDGIQFTYDPVGNLTRKKDNTTAAQYAYTETGKLKSVLLSDNKSVAYQYDADGNLMVRQADGEKKYFLNDRDDVVAEMTDGQVHTVYLTSSILDERLAKVTSQGHYYYIRDINNSVLGVMNEKGELENSYLYGPFGKIRTIKENVENDFYFQGRFYDKQAGAYDYRLRWYDPETMRFNQKDIIPGDALDPLTLNLYLFVRNDPVNFIDPLGLIEIKEAWDAVRSWSKKNTCLSEVCEKFQAGKIKPMIYGKVPEGFESVGLVDRRGWLYEVLKSADPGKSGRFQTIFRDLNQEALGHYGQGDFAGFGATEEAISRSSIPEVVRSGRAIRPSSPPATIPQAPLSPELGPKAPGSGVVGKVFKTLVWISAAKTGYDIITSPDPKEQIKTESGGWLGMGAGLILGGPPGAVIGQLLGSAATDKNLAGKIMLDDQSIQDNIAIRQAGPRVIAHIEEKQRKQVQREFEEVMDKIQKEEKAQEFFENQEQNRVNILTDKSGKVVAVDREGNVVPFPLPEYNPLSDPNWKSGMKESINIAEAEKVTDEFQQGQRGGTKSTTAQSPQQVTKQPESYTTDPGKKPDTSGSTQQPPSSPYPPGYPPEGGQSGVRTPWEGLAPPSSGHGVKTPGRTKGPRVPTSPHPPGDSSSSGTSSSPPRSGSGGKVEQSCTQDITCQGWAAGIECGRAKRRDPSVQCIMNQQQVGNCYYRAWEEGLRRGMGLTNTPKPGGC